MKRRNIAILDAAVLIITSIAGTIAIFLHVGMPILPWEFLKRSALTAIAPVLALIYPEQYNDWFLSKPFCAVCVLIVLGLLVLQIWKKTRWAVALGVMALVAWCLWGALYHLGAIYASC
jgi:hypothetical protein